MSDLKIFTDNIEPQALDQIYTLIKQPAFRDCKVRIMPDVHAGKGCVIGFTADLGDKAIPNIVGVDIGCGMETIRLRNRHLEPAKLDKLIYEKIPSGFHIREKAHKLNDDIDLTQLRCLRPARINLDRAVRSLGTLGGGNHFIEADKDDEGRLYVVIHSGSRHLGLEVAEYYQEQAWRSLNGMRPEIPQPLAPCRGELMEDYIHDMKIVQRFAMLNRKAMMDELIRGMKFKVEEEFTTIHNYIDTDAMILRKGAVSARKGEKLLIPVNMRDGSLICTGKGNEDWNFSAPHGAGRLMSRRKARETYTVSQFKKEMAGIFTTSANAQTLDECPMAYKDMADIVDNIGDTAEIECVIRPIYNFKAGEE